MEIKGELKRGGLPTLFRNFATENFSGVLTISSEVGEKLITLTENEITVFCDELNESSRVGDILLARGEITVEVLEKTLRDQRNLEPRPKLGDLMVERGIITEKANSDARRFQIEEDVCDILSWKDARFHFAGSDSAREIHPEDFAHEQVHRLTIDPDTFFKSVTRLTESWEPLGERLPTQYLCFKPSTKTGETMSSLSKDSQKVLRLLKEGRTIEGAVKQSCLGRIAVCSHVIELLEKGLILPASGTDLRFMAGEHRSQKHFHDALYIYRRLLESPDGADRRQIENLIGEVTEQILQQKQQGGMSEESVQISHREAKERYFRTQRNRKIFWALFSTAAIIVIGFLVIRIGQPKADLGQLYRDTIRKVEDELAAGKFSEAMKDLDALYDNLPDKEGDAARSIQDRKARMPAQIQNYVEMQVKSLTELLMRGGEDRDRAVAALKELNQEFPANSNEQKIKDMIRQYELRKTPVTTNPGDTAAVPPPVATRDELIEKVKGADLLKTQKKYTEAQREYLAITQQAPANGDIWHQANTGLVWIKELEQRMGDITARAEQELAAKHGDKALELAEQAVASYGNLEGLQRALALKTKLAARKSQSQQGMMAAKELEEANRIFEAMYRYEQVADGYPEFPVSAEARVKAIALKTKTVELRKKLESALEAVKNGDFKKARELYYPLLKDNHELLVHQHIELPMLISSIPAGSNLKVNGKAIGVTPKIAMIPAGEQYEIIVERPGFTSKRVAGDKITPRDLEYSISLKLDLDAVVLEFFGDYQQPTPLLAPPAWFDKQLLVLNGTNLTALEPPSKDVLWTISNLYDPRAPLPENVPLDDKNYFLCRTAPIEYKPGFLLLPLRNRELLELDLRNPAKPQKRSLLARMGDPPPELVGKPYFEEHSRLAGKSLFVGAYADGQVRCYEDIEKEGRSFTQRWTLALDPQEMLRKEGPAAGLYGRRGQVWALSIGGRLQSIDPTDNKVTWSEQFQTMSSRSTFSAVPDDNLVVMVQRNGKVILFDLEQKQEVWSLPVRAAMEESVGATIDSTGVYVTTRKEDTGELAKYPRIPTGKATPDALTRVKLDGHVDLDIAQGKHLYLVTHFNKVFAYSRADLAQLWEYKLKPEHGEPTSIRAFGDYVYVSTNKGKIIVLKSE